MYHQTGGRLPVYAGSRIQRGGGILGSIARFLIPTAKKMLTETVRAAPAVVDSIINKKASVGSAILSGLKTAGKNTAQDTFRRVATKRRANNIIKPTKKKRRKVQTGSGDIFTT